jgi:hypothetical protein
MQLIICDYLVIRISDFETSDIPKHSINMPLQKTFIFFVYHFQYNNRFYKGRTASSAAPLYVTVPPPTPSLCVSLNDVKSEGTLLFVSTKLCIKLPHILHFSNLLFCHIY